jgi:hypothetical protein
MEKFVIEDEKMDTGFSTTLKRKEKNEMEMYKQNKKIKIKSFKLSRASKLFQIKQNLKQVI